MEEKIMEKKKKLCDATLFYNEIDMLFFRINHLNPYIDTFFIAESELTFSGLNRRLVLKEVLKSLPSEIKEKIELIEITKDQFNSFGAWEIERQSRNILFEFARNSSQKCRLIFSDIDEIPSEEQLLSATVCDIPDGLMSIPMKLAYRRANWLVDQGNEIWRYPKLVEVEKIINKEAVNVLRECEAIDIPGEKGIHLSYMGMSRNDIQKKYESFSHTELNKPKYYDELLIEYCDKYLISHLGDAEKPGRGLLFEIKEKDLSNIQRKVKKLQPDWINDNSKAGPKLFRFYRSILITMYFLDSKTNDFSLNKFQLKNIKWMLRYFDRKIRRKLVAKSWK
jgi:hypothetical protein